MYTHEGREACTKSARGKRRAHTHTCWTSRFLSELGFLPHPFWVYDRVFHGIYQNIRNTYNILPPVREWKCVNKITHNETGTHVCVYTENKWSKLCCSVLLFARLTETEAPITFQSHLQLLNMYRKRVEKFIRLAARWYIFHVRTIFQGRSRTIFKRS